MSRRRSVGTRVLRAVAGMTLVVIVLVVVLVLGPLGALALLDALN